MKLASQIRQHRTEMGLSQDALAERVFVSRQTVSNWENDKTYPDLDSLLLLSDVFGISLDQLVKGDLETMKQEINAQEIAKFHRNSLIMTVFFLLLLISPIPLAHYLGWWGMAVYLLIAAIGIWFAFQVDRHKKQYDIQTYKEINAFLEGKPLEGIEKAREEGKRPYQIVLIVLGMILLTLAVTLVMVLIFRGM